MPAQRAEPLLAQAELSPQVQQAEQSQVQRVAPLPQVRRLVSAAVPRRRYFLQSERGQQKRPQRVAQSQFYREAWS
jgi:hypothetical protein